MNKTLFTKAEIKEKSDDVFTAIASSEVEDRQGEVVKQAGWNLSNFKKNPILLWMHDHERPLGKATRVWLDKSGTKPLLMFKGVISTATDYGRAAKQLIDEGVLNSFSVGFRALEMDGNQITKAELFEISLVTVPANPEARLLAAKSLQKAGFEDTVIKDVLGDDKDAVIVSLQDKVKDLENKVTEVTQIAEDAVKGLQHLAPLRSKQEIASKRLQSAKLLARVSDKLIVESKNSKTIDRAKLMKRTSEKLIRNLKGDL